MHPCVGQPGCSPQAGRLAEVERAYTAGVGLVVLAIVLAVTFAATALVAASAGAI
jgi:hypothetical protein